jgi:hypothetical protein
MEDDDREKSKLFKEELHKFYSVHGRENFKVPQIGGKELDLYKLFKEVMQRGGSSQVSENKQWKEIVNALELPASCTSASFTLRNHYNRCLHSYENYYTKGTPLAGNMSGGNAGSSSNNLSSSGMNNNQAGNSIQMNPTTNIYSGTMNQSSNQQPTINQPSSQQEQKFLGKKVLRNDAEFNLIYRYQGKPTNQSRDKTYIKKIRLFNAIPDMRRIVLAFESHITSEIVWALNILTLFSANTNCNILIENQPYLMESLTNYMYYCTNNISDLSFIIDILEGTLNVNGNKLEIKKDRPITLPSTNNNLTNANNNIPNSRFKIPTQFQQPNSFVIKTKKSQNEITKGNVFEGVNNSLSLSSISKKNKSLEEIEDSKEEANIDARFEEVTEYELLEHLISLIQILRNLSFIRANEPSVIKCHKFMHMLYLLFIHAPYQEIRFNALDIITNLSKHILLKETKYAYEMMLTIFDCLKSQNRELSEQGLECFRRLIFASGNEEMYERMPDEFFEEMVSLLISYKIEVRESVLEILLCIADQKLPTKTRLGRISKCIPRLVALTCSNSPDSRTAKFAACTLSKLSEVPSILKMIMPYEQELFVAACTDDSITKIILGIISN